MRQATENDRETEPEFRQALDVGKHGKDADCGSYLEKEKLSKNIQTNKIGEEIQILGTRGTWNLAKLK
jgi:hypothetical protein